MDQILFPHHKQIKKPYVEITSICISNFVIIEQIIIGMIDRWSQMGWRSPHFLSDLTDLLLAKRSLMDQKSSFLTSMSLTYFIYINYKTSLKWSVIAGSMLFIFTSADIYKVWVTS